MFQSVVEQQLNLEKPISVGLIGAPDRLYLIEVMRSLQGSRPSHNFGPVYLHLAY